MNLPNIEVQILNISKSLALNDTARDTNRFKRKPKKIICTQLLAIPIFYMDLLHMAFLTVTGCCHMLTSEMIQLCHYHIMD